MSRCFPYPPPGYTLSRASNDALIESIKLQKKKEKVKEQKKEKRSEKKEKKEKRKEKKEKRKENKDEQNQKLHKSDIAKIQILGKLPDTKDEPLLKGKAAEAGQLERSNLTQEHGQPVCLDVLPTSSSESTDASNKRKRHSLPLNDNRVHGNIIRIKLASKKQKNDSNASVNELRLCSESGSTDLATTQNKDCNDNLRHGSESSHSALKTDAEQICSVSRPVEGLMKSKSGIPTLPNAVMTSMGREEMKYNEIIRNWSPPQLLQQDFCLDEEDLDWLFRKPNVFAEKRRKIQNDGVSCLSSSALMQPRAQLLKEINIYALPFTVPF